MMIKLLNAMYMHQQVIILPLLIILAQQYLLSLLYILAQQYLLPLLYILAQPYIVPLPYIFAQPYILLHKIHYIHVTQGTQGEPQGSQGDPRGTPGDPRVMLCSKSGINGHQDWPFDTRLCGIDSHMNRA